MPNTAPAPPRRRRISISDDDVELFLRELATRPDLVEKDAELDPHECLVLGRFACLEETDAFATRELTNGEPGLDLALGRLEREGFVRRARAGARPFAGPGVWIMTRAGHEAEHRFLQQHWPKLRDYPALLGCGTCGGGHTIALG